jgi:hypothetical protein
MAKSNKKGWVKKRYGAIAAGRKKGCCEKSACCSDAACGETT